MAPRQTFDELPLEAPTAAPAVVPDATAAAAAAPAAAPAAEDTPYSSYDADAAELDRRMGSFKSTMLATILLGATVCAVGAGWLNGEAAIRGRQLAAVSNVVVPARRAAEPVPPAAHAPQLSVAEAETDALRDFGQLTMETIDTEETMSELGLRLAAPADQAHRGAADQAQPVAGPGPQLSVADAEERAERDFGEISMETIKTEETMSEYGLRVALNDKAQVGACVETEAGECTTSADTVGAGCYWHHEPATQWLVGALKGSLPDLTRCEVCPPIPHGVCRACADGYWQRLSTGGHCTMVTCDADRLDANGDPLDGCEATDWLAPLVRLGRSCALFRGARGDCEGHDAAGRGLVESWEQCKRVCEDHADCKSFVFFDTPTAATADRPSENCFPKTATCEAPDGNPAATTYARSCEEDESREVSRTVVEVHV